MLDSKRPDLKASLSWLNPLVDAFYVLMISYQTARSTDWLTTSTYDPLVVLSFVFVMGNSNIVRAWRLYVVTHSSESGALYVEMNKMYYPQVPHNLERDVLFNVDIDSEESDEGTYDKIVREENGVWADRMYGTARKKRLWIFFCVVTTLEMIIPTVIMVTTGRDRPRVLRWTCYCMISLYLLSGTSFLIKLWHIRRKYSLWSHLARMCSSWTITCLAVLLCVQLPIESGSDFERYFRVIFSIVPFFFERIWPLLVFHRNVVKASDYSNISGIEHIITQNAHGNAEGWKALASYIDEVEPSFDCRENKMLAYGIQFLREYLTNRDKIKYRSSSVGDEGIDNDLCGLVILTWMKFLYKKGDFTWERDMDVESCFTLSSPRIQSIKKDMEDSLVNMVRESDPSKNKRFQRKAAAELRRLYDTVLTDTEKKMLKGFRKSHQFQTIIKNIQRERKTDTKR